MMVSGMLVSVWDINSDNEIVNLSVSSFGDNTFGIIFAFIHCNIHKRSYVIKCSYR